MLLGVAISKDGNFSIEIASLFKNIVPSSHLYMKLKTYRQIIDTHILNGNTKAVIVKIRESNKPTHLVSKIVGLQFCTKK